MDLDESLSVMADRVARVTHVERELELTVRRAETLSALFGGRASDCLETTGTSMRAIARSFDKTGVGSADSAFFEDADWEPLIERASAAPAPLRVPALRTGIKVAGPRPDALSSDRAHRWGSALVEPLGRIEGAVQTVLVTQRLEGIAIANSHGLRVAEWRPSEAVLVRHETNAGAIVDGLQSPHLDLSADAERLIQRVSDAVDTVAQPGGEPEPTMPWVIRPAVAAPWVTALCWLIRADVAQSGGLARALGKKLFPSVLNLADDPNRGPRRASFDDEGRETGLVRPVIKGILTELFHTSQTADALTLTANARAFWTETIAELSPSPLNGFVEPSSAELPATYNELSARFEVFNAMPKPGRVTSIVAGWVVREGKRVRRIAPFELELPVLEAFRQLTLVGSDLVFFPSHGGCGTPSLVLSSLPRVRSG